MKINEHWHFLRRAIKQQHNLSCFLCGERGLKRIPTTEIVSMKGYQKGRTMSVQTLDPMDDAVQAAESAGQYFGRLDVSAQYVTLKKGERKRLWMEGDNTEGRVSEVTLRLNPHDISGLTRMVERQTLANSREWSNIIWPSLRELGFKSLRDIQGKWGHIALVKNGESYERDGVKVEKTTFKFLAVYELESDLIKAWEATHSAQAHTSSSNSTVPAVSQGNEAEKAAAAQFLPHVVGANKHDRQALAAALASMSPINKYFTVDSPEVQALLEAR